MPVYVFECNQCQECIEGVFSLYEPLPEDLRHKSIESESECTGWLTRVFTPPNFNKRQGASNVTIDRDNRTGRSKAKITEHWDGRQDVTVKPSSVKLKTTQTDE